MVMALYCKTLSALDGKRHCYGIDLVAYRDGAYYVLQSAKAVSAPFDQICRLVAWMNEVALPPEHLKSLMDALWDCGNTEKSGRVSICT